MTYANEYGFLPGADAEENSKALQKAVDFGGEILVEAPGIYDMAGTVEIGDDTTLVFKSGVQIRRQNCLSGRNGMLFLNKGCDSATRNKNIKIIGLHIDCNGVESSDAWEDSRLVGLSAHVGMIYIENLVVEDFECTGILAKDYAIQISAFKNIRVENIYCSGDKDGVHLGWGDGFVIRHGKFRTFDDPIALNAFDYSTSNTHVGWIENGVIEDCYDLPAESTTGFFCRILGGAWCDWYKGMQVQHSDTVCYNGRVYRVVMRPNGEFLTSNTPPSHTRLGEIGVYDGIHWVCVRDVAVYDCGCRNIIFRDIHLQKERDHAMQISLNSDNWARSYYPGCKIIPQSNLVFERISVENKIKVLLGSDHPCEKITVADTDLKNTKIAFEAIIADGLSYPTADLTLRNVICREDSVVFDSAHPVNVLTLG